MKLAQDVLAELGRPLELVESGLRLALSDASPETQNITMHLVESGGKRVRPIMTLLAARLFDSDVDKVVEVAVAGELIHMATLVHDDVIDEAETRRNHQTVNRLWGNHTSVLTGDALLAKALVLLVDHGTPLVVRIMADMIYQMCEGEIAQNVRGADVDQDEDEYYSRIEKKTALFFAACCEAGARMMGADEDEAAALRSYGRNIGMAFQVVDDLLDVSGEADVVGKPIGNDLLSGVITLPVIHLLRDPRHGSSVQALLSKGTPEHATVQRVIDLVREAGGIDYSYGVALAFSERAKEDISRFHGSSVHALLTDIADLVVNRNF